MIFIISNVERYGASGKRLRIATGRQGDHLVVTVAGLPVTSAM